jgi:hypothetical protein
MRDDEKAHHPALNELYRDDAGNGSMFLVYECISVDLSCDPRHLGTEPDLGRQLTGGSYSTRMSYDLMRRVGATARDMFIRAEIRSPRTTATLCILRLADAYLTAIWSYGDLAEAALSLAPSENVSLRTQRRSNTSASRSNFSMFGRNLPARPSMPSIKRSRACCTQPSSKGAV